MEHFGVVGNVIELDRHAREAQPEDFTAMVLATADRDGKSQMRSRVAT